MEATLDADYSNRTPAFDPADVSFGATVSPFASRAVEEIALEERYLRAAATRESTAIDVAYRLEEAIIDAVVAQTTLAYTEAAVEVERQQVSVVEQMYQLGEATYLDVDDAQKTLDAARLAYTEARRSVVGARKTLTTVSAGAVDGVAPEEIAIEGVERLVEAKGEWLADVEASGSDPWTLATRLAEIDLSTLEGERRAASVYNPELVVSVTTTADFSAQAVALQARFSLDQWNGDAVSDIEEDVADARMALRLAQRSLELDATLSRELVAIAENDVLVARADLSTARLAMRRWPRCTRWANGPCWSWSGRGSPCRGVARRTR